MGKKDAWTSENTRVVGFESPGRGSHVSLTKERDGYRINLKWYEMYTFVEVKPGVLECKVLGTITRGTLKFEGRDAAPILTADFCNEQFYLFGPK